MTQTAAVQHSCPPDQIQILEDNGDGYARVVQMDVCGERRVYQDQGGRHGFVWVDQTPITAGAEGPAQERTIASTSPSSTAAPTSTTDPFAASVRARIAQHAVAILVCSGGPVAVEAHWDPSRSTTVALNVRGVNDAAVAECIGTAIGSIAVPSNVSPGRVVHAVSN